MELILKLLDFAATPVGQAIVNVVPTFIADVVALWHKEGKVTTEDIANYIAQAKSFDELVPKKVA